jgi:hypothetical protein
LGALDFTGSSIVSVAARVACHLAEVGIECVVVGGLAVEIYTENKYQTKDIDMVNISMNSQSELDAAMGDIGFFRKQKTRYYHNDSTSFFVEFPSPPLGVAGNTEVKPATIETDSGNIQILSVEDIIRDRLAWACNGRGDRQAITQALCLMLNQNMEPSEFSDLIQDQSESEADCQQITSLCHNTYERAKKEGVTAMEAVEKLVEDEFINSL